jgi:hypothetical protein
MQHPEKSFGETVDAKRVIMDANPMLMAHMILMCMKPVLDEKERLRDLVIDYLGERQSVSYLN